MAHTLPPLPYDENALAPYVSAQTLSFHYGKHHTGYLNNMNKAIAGTELESLSLVDLIRTVAKNAEQKTLFNNAAQVWNHTFYWNSMRPGGGGEPGGTLGELIKDSFGSYDEFKKQFITAGTTQFGSGYAWLVKDGEKLVVTKTPTPRPSPTRARCRCSTWTSGSTPTTSTTRTCAPTTKMPSPTT